MTNIDVLGPCPRCGQPLSPGVGALGEASCSACAARFLDRDAVERVRDVFLKIEPTLFAEMARAGAPAAPCPRCRTTLRVQQVRGVAVDLCSGCGGALLDAGELLAWSRGALAEVAATAAPTHSTPRWIVACTSCDDELDLDATIYAVNDRPWCAGCVRAQGLTPLSHVMSMTIGPLLSLLGFVLGAMLAGRRSRWRAFAWGRRPDRSLTSAAAVVEKVPPDQVGTRFARFARRAD